MWKTEFLILKKSLKKEKLKLALQFTEISVAFVTVGNNIQFASDCKSIIWSQIRAFITERISYIIVALFKAFQFEWLKLWLVYANDAFDLFKDKI